MVNNEQEIDKKLSQASPSPNFLKDHQKAALGLSSSSDQEHEHGEDEFYDPELAAMASQANENN